MIDHFKDVMKPAIKYFKRGKICQKSFNEFYDDIHRMLSLFEAYKLRPSDKIGIYILPYQYDFYVTIFAGILFQLNLVIFDSYKKNRIQQAIKTEPISACFVDSKTKFLFPIFFKQIKKINVSNYKKYEMGHKKKLDEQATVLTTFTSGTTGIPKPIYRSFTYLKKQVLEIQNEIDLDSFDVVFGGLPIYNLLSLFTMKTTCIAKNVNRIYQFQPNCILTNIQKLLRLKKRYYAKTYVMMGGAILYQKEAQFIQNIFPNAYIQYIYGASEKAIIYKVDLEKYIQKPFTFSIPSKDVEVTIQTPNEEGVGEILIQGERVNTLMNCHLTGDIGKIVDNELTILGRKKYSSLEEKVYNYVLDEELRQRHMQNVYSFYYENMIYVVSTKRLKNRIEGFQYISFHKLPFDSKHKTKLNYESCIKKIQNKRKFTKKM